MAVIAVLCWMATIQ